MAAAMVWGGSPPGTQPVFYPERLDNRLVGRDPDQRDFEGFLSGGVGVTSSPQPPSTFTFGKARVASSARSRLFLLMAMN